MVKAAGGINKINYNSFDKKHKLRTVLMKSLRLLPDKTYLKFMFRIRNGKKLNLDNPKTFCDKINWLILNQKHSEYTQLVDKVAERDYIKEKIGEEHLFPVYGVWDSFDEIDFDSLPESFVLKCNHDSGSYKIIKN